MADRDEIKPEEPVEQSDEQEQDDDASGDLPVMDYVNIKPEEGESYKFPKETEEKETEEVETEKTEEEK